ncbi:MAG: hypothetical protein H8D45_21565, partial [Bacteroidetes bacterium]|nr:hypothetical protein [Bacteroidota bacterium]
MSRSINKTFAVVLSLLISSVVLSQEKNTIQKQMSTLTITETSEPTTEELVVTSDYRSVSYEWIERSDNTATNQESLKNYYRSDFNWFIITLAAMYGGYELMKRGYVVLGRDIMVGAPLTYLTRRQIVRYQRSWGPLSQLQVWVSYEDDLGQEKYKMTAGDKGEIVCRITNPGPKRVKGIKPTIEPEGDYHLLQSLVVGQIQTTHRKSRFGNFRLNSGESMEIRLPISIPKTVPESNLKIVADISLVPNKSRNFRIENFNPPNIVLKVLDFDDQDRNHVLEGLEKGRLRIIVRNEGMGPARNIQLNLLSGDRNISIDPNN